VAYRRRTVADDLTCTSRAQHPVIAQSWFGSQDHWIESIAKASSPQTAAEAWALVVPVLSSTTFLEPGWTARRFFDAGAHTTRHEIEQSTGIEQELWIVKSTV